MKTPLFFAIHMALNALLEISIRLGYPLIHLLLKRYQYTPSLRIPKALRQNSILIHASSVGEVNAVAPLVKALVEEIITINTITITGRDQARKLFPDIQCEIAPLDIYSWRKIQMREYMPKLILIVETEIWPNMLLAARKYHVPVIFVNARMSETSLKRYKHIRPYFSYLGTGVHSVLAQSEADAARFSQLLSCEVKNTGNLKFAISLPSFDADDLRQQMGIASDSFVICFGSTRPKEEELLLGILPQLKESIPNLVIIIAPRHPKRCDEVWDLYKDYQTQRYSSLIPHNSYDVLLIDTLGRLTACYAISDITIVGGSFIDFRGHNPLEPAFYAKPIIYGPHFSSCRDSIRALQSKEAVIISNKDLLLTNILKLHQNPTSRQEMGKRAKEVLSENDRALEITLQEVRNCLS